MIPAGVPGSRRPIKKESKSGEASGRAATLIDNELRRRALSFIDSAYAAH